MCLHFIHTVRTFIEKVERCYISLPEEAQWNWLMLINDLWCQSCQVLFAYSQNSAGSRRINICTLVKLSLFLCLHKYHSIAIQITMHVVQIAVTYAVCWLVWENVPSHPWCGISSSMQQKYGGKNASLPSCFDVVCFNVSPNAYPSVIMRVRYSVSSHSLKGNSIE